MYNRYLYFNLLSNINLYSHNRTNSFQNILSEATKRPAIELGPDNLPLKQKRKIDRFDGMPEEEVAKKFLPDHLGPNMDILIVSCV